MRKAGRWSVILVMFIAFAFAMLVGMAGLGTAANESDAASALVGSHSASEGAFVVVSTDAKRLHPLFNRFFGINPKVEVCWATNRQLSSIKQRWKRTTMRKVTVKRRGTFKLITVRGATKTALRRKVSGTLSCKLVRRRSAFFLPLDGAVS